VSVVESDVTLALGAEDNDLAVWVSECLRRNLAKNPLCRRDFDAMRAAVAMVAPDRQQQCTLRFDHGHLAIHDGMLGVPDLTFCGDFSVLTGLESFPLTRWGRLPFPALARRRAALWRQSVMELVTGELKIYGLVQHPRLVTRLLRLLSQGS
jgi:hypothetical protein